MVTLTNDVQERRQRRCHWSFQLFEDWLGSKLDDGHHPEQTTQFKEWLAQGEGHTEPLEMHCGLHTAQGELEQAVSDTQTPASAAPLPTKPTSVSIGFPNPTVTPSPGLRLRGREAERGVSRAAGRVVTGGLKAVSVALLGIAKRWEGNGAWTEAAGAQLAVIPKRASMWSGCDVRIRRQPCLLPTALIVYCPFSRWSSGVRQCRQSSCAFWAAPSSLAPLFSDRLDLRRWRLYRFRRTSWSGVCPLPCVLAAGPHCLGLSWDRRLTNPGRSGLWVGAPLYIHRSRR